MARCAAVLLAALLVVPALGGCDGSLPGRPVAAPAFRTLAPQAPSRPTPSAGSTSTGTTSGEPTSTGTTSTEPTGGGSSATAAVCAVLEQQVPDTLDAVDDFVAAVTASSSGSLPAGDPAVTGALDALGSTGSALDAALARGGAALPQALARDATELERSLDQVGQGIATDDAGAFNDAIDAVGSSYADAESHCRFV